MYKVIFSNRFKRDYKRCLKRGMNINLLDSIIVELEAFGKVPANYRPHPLSGKYKGCMECHLQPDWLLIWRQNDRELQLLLLETGTHTDLF